MTRRPTAARLRPLLIALAVAAPAATALAVGEDPAPLVVPSTSPSHIVGEQVGTARGVVPWGASRDEGRTLTFAVGQTRGPSPELPVAPSTPRLVRTSPPQEGPPDVALPPSEEEDDDEGGKREQAPPPSTPIVSVLLEGTTRTATAPTAWKRSAPPLDAAGAAMTPGSWRPAGAHPENDDPHGTASAHAGEATPNGAAALLVTLTPESGPSTAAVLVRTADRGFRVLPAPPAELLAPATRLSDPDAVNDLAPFAVFDVAPASGEPAPPYGRTGVLIAPSGSDGVLAWDGTAWHEEPFLDTAGEPAAPEQPATALAATPDGDAAALVPGNNGATVDRISLLRRLPKGAGWRPMTINAPLLSGPMPTSVQRVEAVKPPGDPLTITAGHWWVDVNAWPDGGGNPVAATVHLKPGPVPTTPGTTPPSTDPLPSATDPSTPESSSPETTPPTSPVAVPAASLQLTATRTWCEGSSPNGAFTPGVANPALCDAEFPARFPDPTERGYRSIGFAGPGALPDGAAPTTPSPSTPYGGRVITNPLIDVSRNPQSFADSSASGGYLRLDGDEFTLRGGIGETPNADNLTDTAAFLSDRLGWTGGRSIIGHVTTAADPDAGTYLGTSPVAYEPVIDLAAAPAPLDPGAAVLSASSLRRIYGDGRPPDSGDGLYAVISDREPRTPRAVAWPNPDSIYVVGTNGLLARMEPPQPRTIADEIRGVESPELLGDFESLDFTDIGFSNASVGGATSADFDGWAVGRDGLAVHLSTSGGGGALPRTELVALTGDLAKADLRQVAYAGNTAYVASTAGLLVASEVGTGANRKWNLALDAGLSGLLAEDRRPADIDTVAALPDGTVVVDARYVRREGGPWERLPSPAEGDVVALAISRDPDTPQTGLSGLRIEASIGDQSRPRRGDFTTRQVAETRFIEIEQPAVAPEGRHVELTADGWVDRVRTPVDVAQLDDAAVPSVPTQAFASGPGGSRWAASGIGGSGLFDDYDLMIQMPRGGITSLTTVRPDGVAAVPTARVGATAAAGKRAQTPSGTSPDATTPTTPEGSTPTTPSETTPNAEIPAAGPGAAPVRILIGGHPACFASCTGRADQRVAPTESLRQALDTAARMRERGGPAAPSAVVIGGGRTARRSVPLDRTGARAYVDLLHGGPGTPPVYAAIGTGDQWQEGGRSTFAEQVAGALRPTRADGMVPVTSPAPPGGNTVAYAFDIPGSDGGAARIVVADTADVPTEDSEDGTPSPWTAGAHGKWLDAVLRDAERLGRPAVVIGAAQLAKTPDGAEKRSFLMSHGVYAYVSTDGADDPYKLTFGTRESRETITGEGGREMLLLHTSALGHVMPQPTLNRNRQALMDSDFNEGPLADLTSPSLLELSIPTERASLRRIVPRAVPVFRSFLTPETRPLAAGEAGGLSLPTLLDADNGIRFTDEYNPDATSVPAWGYGVGEVAPYPCRLWLPVDECGEEIDSIGEFSIADPTIALFVRARMSKKDRNGPPEILTAPNGDPIPDANSPIICALKPGETTATATVSGRSVTMPIRVVERPSSMPDQKGKCAFFWGRSDNDDGKEIASPTPAKPVINPIVPGPSVLEPPSPGPTPKATHSPQPAQPTVPLPVTPLLALPMASMEAPGPTVAPNPKPFTTPPTPTPPTGVNSHAWTQVPSPIMQFQVATAMQEQRREQLARESAEHHATIYRAEPRSPLVPALAGGAGLAVIAGAAGVAAGRRRALRQAAQRSWIG